MEYFTTAAGITVHILDSEDKSEKASEKKTLILLHGYLETLYIWSEFADMLKDKYRIITFDLPGHGLTDSAPEDENGESVNTMEFCADVTKALLEKCNVSKAYIGGHSLGGYISQVCCIKYPETFEKLIIFNSTPYADLPEKANDRMREVNAIQMGKLETLAFISIPKMYHIDNLRKFDDKIRETVELCETHNPEGIIASLKGMQRRKNTQDFLKECPLPTIHFSGDQDPFLPMSTLEKMMADYPKVKFVHLPGTGHISFVENSVETCERVCEFLG